MIHGQRDIRETKLYREVEALALVLRRTGSAQISDAADIQVAPDGRRAVFTATIVDKLEGATPTRIALTDLSSGDTRVLTSRSSVDRAPKFSPDGLRIAFLSDRRVAGDFQLYLLNLDSGAVQATPPVDGWVEYLHWSPDGARILLGVAGHGADIAGGHGAITSRPAREEAPSWMPIIDTGDETCHWRRAWVYRLATNTVQRIEAPQINVWEAVWCGSGTIAAICSPGPSEGLWYTARLYLIEISNGSTRELHRPPYQLGWPAASPSGKHLAVVEALCSDRWYVAGDLQLIDTVSGEVNRVDTHSVDITYAEWRSERCLLVAGHRGFESVAGVHDVASGKFSEVWKSAEVTAAGFYISVAGMNDSGDFALVGEGFTRAPEIALVRKGEYRPVKSFDLGYSEEVKTIGSVEQRTWRAPDGLDIQGWLLSPRTVRRPYPLVLFVHGGPVGHHRPRWLGRAGLHILTLLKHGYAVLLPNPRGSSGSGQAFARHVLGELGGAETQDHLSGLDYLVQQGVADPDRLGVTGVSHGGFMTSWIITQDPRFAAAVAVSPVTNHVTEQLISNIPHFVELFLQDKYTNPEGKYFSRSPVMHAHKVRTPTLLVCGALDRCTPPEEAVQFHNALRANGMTSVLVTYPEEGHHVRKLPANIDFSARLVAWFEAYMPAEANP
jgi:dipeptidyl aminopeptidase/acylaminoacyl peptidase